MHAQRGGELGNGTTDEHSGTLMRRHGPNVGIRAGRSQPPTGDQSAVPPGNMADRFFPSVFISAHSRFPIERSTASKTVRHRQLGRVLNNSPTYERVEGRTTSYSPHLEKRRRDELPLCPVVPLWLIT
jgi:hypothetical protein